MAEPSEKPSFASSVMSGVSGYFKAAISTAIITGIAAVAIVSGGAATGLIAQEALKQAISIAGSIVGALSATAGVAGVVAGVIKSREAAQPDASDVVNVAKIAFAQGVAVGHNVEAMEKQETKFRDKIAQERGIVTGPQKV